MGQYSKMATVGAAGEDQRSEDLSPLIQAIVNRSGWTSGNALNIIATAQESVWQNHMDGSSSKAPILMIEYLEPIQLLVAMLMGTMMPKTMFLMEIWI